VVISALAWFILVFFSSS